MAETLTAVRPVYRDPWLLAVYKPPGLLVHRNTRFADQDAAVQQARDLAQQHVYPVHRLDRAVSGLLLFALDPGTARHLEQQFRTREVGKRYLAIVRGWTEPTGEIDRPLRGEGGRGPAREALTRYRRLATTELDVPVGRYATARYSLLEVAPKTGRWHQIRRHLNGIDHPVIGDTAHGDRAHNRFFDRQLGRRRLLLLSMRLSLSHPALEQPLALAVAPDPGLQAVMRWLGWDPDRLADGSTETIVDEKGQGHGTSS